MSVAVRFKNISKQYRLGEIGTGTLSHDLHRAWAMLLRKPDPFSQVGAVNNREISEQKAKSIRHGFLSRFTAAAFGDSNAAEYVWALKDISFDVYQGQIIGIIGRNGAGKSTLLKLLSRVTAPTGGSIKAKGRIASLLEVGTGFHPELTGRENIYLNGAILGMSRREVTRQLEQIVEFSGCAKYIDTPVKRYSSGMTVRLGFAVAAHLQCEVLIVDEVLAVGDTEFQKKCISKMREVAGGGRTVLFVSHNMAAVRSLCERAIRLDKGTVMDDGPTSDVVNRYLAHETSHSLIPLADRTDRAGDGTARITSLQIKSTANGDLITSTCPLEITIGYAGTDALLNPKVMIGIYDEYETGIYGLNSEVTGGLPSELPSRGTIQCVTNPINITAGRCFLNIAMFVNGTLADHVINAYCLNIETADFFGNGRTIERSWMNTLIRHEWKSAQG
jgi:lipopolysaccharide transport system ATP-binding protein